MKHTYVFKFKEGYILNEQERLQEAKLKKYIKKKYYKNNQETITIHIKDEEELYNSLDPSRDTLSSSVTDYLERSVETLLPLNKIIIKIDCKKKIDLNNFQKCLQVHYGIENLNSERIEKKEHEKSIYLLVVALLTLSTFLFMDSLYETRYFIVTLALWEYFGMKIYRDEENEIKKYIYKLLDDAVVTE